MITTNVIRRTFHINSEKQAGTAFTIDQNGRQYLVTAYHVVDEIDKVRCIDISHEGRWKRVPVSIIGIDEELDVAVLACNLQLSPEYSLEPTIANLTYGQQLYYLGFPFGWDSGNSQMNRGFPIPFVKSAILSAMPEGGGKTLFIDTILNKGFSGGPVVFKPQGQSHYQVAGVVVNYPTPILEPVVNKHEEAAKDFRGEDLYFQENPGLAIVTEISRVVELINDNPKGFLLPKKSGEMIGSS